MYGSTLVGFIQFGTAADFFVFTHRHEEVKIGVEYLFKRKRLTNGALRKAKERRTKLKHRKERRRSQKTMDKRNK